jgi:hypothetical protein
MTEWATELGLSAAELRWLEEVASAHECSQEQFVRKTIWQELRRHLPSGESDAVALFPPGFGGRNRRLRDSDYS